MDLQKIVDWYDLSGKTVVITGGTGLLGGNIAVALLGVGANVILLDRNPVLPENVKKAAEIAKGTTKTIQCDVLDKGSLNLAIGSIKKDFPKIDVLINAAGGNHPKATTSTQVPFFDLPTEGLRFVFDLNILGTILPCQLVGKEMANQGSGVIINISSMNAYRPLTRIPAYSAAKAGVSNFTQWLAVHLAREYDPNIRVNAIAPGFFSSAQNQTLLYNEDGSLSDRGQTIIEHTPMHRFGAPDELIGTVLWLISPASKFVTGIVVPVDGGFSAFSGV